METMRATENRLDVLLIADEYVQNTRQSFRNFESWVQWQAPHFTDVVKRKVENTFRVKDFLCPSRADASHLKSSDYELVLPRRPSLALCDLATVIKAAGYEVCIIDNFMQLAWRQEQMQNVIRQHKPRLIGLSTTLLLSPPRIKKVVRQLREIAPDSKIVLGGPTVRANRDLHQCADFAVFGAGEEAILGILEVLDSKRDASTVDNIAFCDRDGDLQYSGGAKKSALVGKKGIPYRADPSLSIPVPDWSLYHRSRRNVYSIEYSRGCKYNCFYCSYERGKEVRDLADIRRELLANAALGITRYRIADSNFTDGPPTQGRYPHDICQLKIDLDLGLEWSCYSRVDDLSDKLAALMKQSGCFAVFFGIESGDDHILKLMRKGHNVADAYHGIEVAKKHGLFVHANFVVGYPGETHDTYRNTIEFIKRSRPDSVTFSQLYLTPHSPIYGDSMAGYEIDGSDLNWCHKTMDSETAEALVLEGMEELIADGIVLGNEYEFSTLMSVGFSAIEVVGLISLRSMNNRVNRSDNPPSDDVPDWLWRTAKEVAIDQAEMEEVGP